MLQEQWVDFNDIDWSDDETFYWKHSLGHITAFKVDKNYSISNITLEEYDALPISSWKEPNNVHKQDQFLEPVLKYRYGLPHSDQDDYFDYLSKVANASRETWTYFESTLTSDIIDAERVEWFMQKEWEYQKKLQEYIDRYWENPEEPHNKN